MARMFDADEYGFYQNLGSCFSDNAVGTTVSLWVSGLPKPTKVYFNGNNTTVEWSDGVKTKAGLHDEEWDDEKGVAMAIARRFLGRGAFERLLENANDQRR